MKYRHPTTNTYLTDGHCVDPQKCDSATRSVSIAKISYSDLIGTHNWGNCFDVDKQWP